MRALVPIALALTLPCASSCVITVGSGSSWSAAWWSDDRYDYEHVEELSLPGDLARLALASDAGDIDVQPTSGSSRIRVQLLEEEEDDGYAVLEDGVLRAHSRGDGEVAIGDVTLYVSGELPELVLSSGAGDIRLEGVPVRDDLTVTTGAGDVRLADLGSPGNLRVSTGAGDLQAKRFTCKELQAKTGAGDIFLKAIRAADAKVSTGAGDVRIETCEFERCERVTTGVGDIEVRDSSLGGASFSTGMGSVRTWS